jgi:hypothetical protein
MFQHSFDLNCENKGVGVHKDSLYLSYYMVCLIYFFIYSPRMYIPEVYGIPFVPLIISTCRDNSTSLRCRVYFLSHLIISTYNYKIAYIVVACTFLRCTVRCTSFVSGLIISAYSNIKSLHSRVNH